MQYFGTAEDGERFELLFRHGPPRNLGGGVVAHVTGRVHPGTRRLLVHTFDAPDWAESDTHSNPYRPRSGQQRRVYSNDWNQIGGGGAADSDAAAVGGGGATGSAGDGAFGGLLAAHRRRTLAADAVYPPDIVGPRKILVLIMSVPECKDQSVDASLYPAMAAPTNSTTFSQYHFGDGVSTLGGSIHGWWNKCSYGKLSLSSESVFMDVTLPSCRYHVDRPVCGLFANPFASDAKHIAWQRIHAETGISYDELYDKTTFSHYVYVYPLTAWKGNCGIGEQQVNIKHLCVLQIASQFLILAAVWCVCGATRLDDPRAILCRPKTRPALPGLSGFAKVEASGAGESWTQGEYWAAANLHVHEIGHNCEWL